jgi:hypothetical protein
MGLISVWPRGAYLECLGTKRSLWVVKSRLHSSGQSTLAKALITHFLAWTNILLQVVRRKLYLYKLTWGQFDTSARHMWFKLTLGVPGEADARC